MSLNLIKYAFVAGEVSPTLLGRTDLTKYDFGMALAKNWFIDYRGGMSTRAGTEFLDEIAPGKTRAFEFQFAPNVANTYCIIFGDNYIRFMQDGGYILEAAKTITGITKTSPGVVTAAGHGYSTGELVRISGVAGMTQVNSRTFEIAVLTANTFSLRDPTTHAGVSTAAFSTYTSGGTVSRVYTLNSPYGSDDLDDLGYEQVRDTVRLTHVNYPIKNLIRNDQTVWELTNEVIGNYDGPPTGLTGTPSASGTASTIYSVSAIMADGTETIPCKPVLVSNCINFTTEEGSVGLTWNKLDGAVEYIVYRSIVISSGTSNAGTQLGFLTRTAGTSFTDSNVVPDFTKSPYEHYDPFAVAAIDKFTITNVGSGYSFAVDAVITDSTGSGFVGYGIVNTAGAITAVKILRRGSGYTAPTVSFGGTATATITITPSKGTYPSRSAIFQQRQIYAATVNNPLTINASRVRNFSNFDISLTSTEGDAYEYDVDSAQVTPIVHLFPTRGGLFLMTATGIWLLNSDASGPVTNQNAQSEPQTGQGTTNVKPLKIGGDFLYGEARGNAVRLLSYSELSRNYGGTDVSVLSNHFFGPGRQITRWAFTENPHKLVQAVREDGSLLLFTVVKEQDVYAWTWAQTRGFYQDVVSIRGEFYDEAYYIVKRYINGAWRQYIERQARRDFVNIEDAWAVDCGLRLEPPTITTSLTISPEYLVDGEKFVNLVGAFTGKTGHWVRAAGGIFVVQSETGTAAVAKVIVSATDLIPEDPLKRVNTVTSWSVGERFTTFSGLWHLEGEEVSILGDGSVFPNQVVTNGQITLSDGVTKCLIGLGFSCVARTLPPVISDTAIESRRKRVVGLGVRLSETRGLKIGRTLNQLYELRERTTELYSSPTFTINGMKYKIISTNWDNDGQTYFVQDAPLPATLLGIVPDLEVGDDPD